MSAFLFNFSGCQLKCLGPAYTQHRSTRLVHSFIAQNPQSYDNLTNLIALSSLSLTVVEISESYNDRSTLGLNTHVYTMQFCTGDGTTSPSSHILKALKAYSTILSFQARNGERSPTSRSTGTCYYSPGPIQNPLISMFHARLFHSSRHSSIRPLFWSPLPIPLLRLFSSFSCGNGGRGSRSAFVLAYL